MKTIVVDVVPATEPQQQAPRPCKNPDYLIWVISPPARADQAARPWHEYGGIYTSNIKARRAPLRGAPRAVGPVPDQDRPRKAWDKRR